MSHFLKLFFVFFTAFALEVRVKAFSEGQKTASSSCFFFKGCVQQIEKYETVTSSYGEKVYFSAGTLFRNEKRDRVTHFVEGQILFEDVKKPYEIRTLHASIWVDFGDLLVEVNNSTRVSIKNLNSNIRIQARDGSTLSLPVGFEVWIEGVTTEGKNLVGVIQPIQLETLQINFKVAKSKKDEWRDAHGDITKRAAQHYHQTVQRELASIQERKNLEEKKRQKEQERLDQERQRILEKSFSR